VAVALTAGKVIEYLLDFAVADDPPESYIAGVLERHHDFEAAGFDVEEVELFNSCAEGAAADLLYNPDAMIGVNHFIANSETWFNIHEGHPTRGVKEELRLLYPRGALRSNANACLNN
jgi:hypothetical protein